MKISHHHLATVDSTNSWAKLHAEKFAPSEITLITADVQTAGRGRFHRPWLSPAHENIYATYCVFLDQSRKDIGNLPQVAALTIAQVLSNLGFSPQLKWPNDVILNKRKVSGILSETTLLKDKIFLVIGIGINLNMSKESLQEIGQPATSLKNESGEHYQVNDVLNSLTSLFAKSVSIFFNDGFSSFLSLYRSLLYAPSHPVRIQNQHSFWEGTIDSINSDGSLNLRLFDNSLQVIHSGEILFINE